MSSSEETLDINYSLPHRGKIFAAKLFDFFSVVILSICLYFFTLTIIQNSPGYKNLMIQRGEMLKSSLLYVGSDESPERLDFYLESNKEMTYLEKNDTFENNLTYFYTVFLSSEMSGEGEKHYVEVKQKFKINGKSALFSETGERIYTNPDYDINYYEAYQSIYNDDAIPHLSLKANYRSIRLKIVLSNVIGLIITVSVSHMLVYLLVPLVFKRGKVTFGMKLTKLAYVAADGFSVSWKRYLGQYFFSFFLEFWASAVAFLVPFGVSLGFFFVRKDRQTLANYVSGIYLVDASDSDIYLDKFEYLKKMEKLEAFTAGEGDIKLHQ
ncbi:MAG: hypothetical protein K5694_01280 [Bacilli bacterium]|nr:hypothetical protein [Bacilli bacterium]